MKEKGSIKFRPSERCLICNKKIEDIGGRRITAHQFKGFVLSDKYRGGGNKDYPEQSFKLNDNEEKYVVVWGSNEMWTDEAIQRAKDEFNAGRRPWFCQVCGNRKCSICGSPINYPQGCDVLDDDGSSSHCGIFPFTPGCSNPACDRNKKNDK